MLISIYASYVFYLPLNPLFCFISGLSPVIPGSTREYRSGLPGEVLRVVLGIILSEVWGRVSYHALPVSKGLYWLQTGFKPLPYKFQFP